MASDRAPWSPGAMDAGPSTAANLDDFPPDGSGAGDPPLPSTPVPLAGPKSGAPEPRPPVPGGEARLFSETAAKLASSQPAVPAVAQQVSSSSSPLTQSRRGSRSSRHSSTAAHHVSEHAADAAEVPADVPATPPYLRWAESLRYLLQDIEGVQLFKQYLEQEHCSNTLDFWFACQGFKFSVDPSDTQKIYQLIKVIYRTYIRGETAVCIQPETRKDIYEKISKKMGLDQTIFDAAQLEVETLMRNTTYPAFLKSDLYVYFVQSGGESPCRPVPSTPPHASCLPPPPPPAAPLPPSGLPPLDEERELRAEELAGPRLPHSASFGGVPAVHPSSSSAPFPTAAAAAPPPPPPAASQQHSAPGTPLLQHAKPPAPLTTENLLVSRFYRAELSRRPETLAGTYLQSPEHARKPPNPYHVSYAPVSTQDSELQSLSSDAHTDETLSLTDSSVDGSHAHSRKHWKHQRRAMRRSAAQNRDTALHHSLIPRTVEQRERPLPKERNIAEIDPPAFARILTEKLERVIEDQTKVEKINKLFQEQAAMAGEEHCGGGGGGGSGGGGGGGGSGGGSRGASVPRNRLEAWAGRLMLAARMAPLHQDAQDILEDHCSRIWEKSAEQTPAGGTRSPPEQHHVRPPTGAAAAAAAAAAVAARGLGVSRGVGGRRPPPDVASQFSYDSGVTADFAGSCSLGGSEVAASISMTGGSAAAAAAGLSAAGAAASGATTTELAHHRHVHHYHYHHHYEPAGGAGPDGPRGPPGQPGTGPVHPGGGHISADSYEAIDSGVSCVYDVPPAMARSSSASGPPGGGGGGSGGGGASVHHHSSANSEAASTSNEKVLAWIIGSDPGASMGSRHKARQATSISSGGGSGATPGRGSKGAASLPGVPTAATAASSAGSKSRASTAVQATASTAQMPSGSTPGSGPSAAGVQRVSSGPQATSSPRAATAEVSREPSVSNASTLSNRSERSAAAQRAGLGRSGSGSQGGASGPASSTAAGSAPGSVVGGPAGGSGESLVVGYYLCGDPVPYRIQWHGRQITLGQFKNLIAKKGNYRYFFKKACDEFETGVVKEEINNDDEVLPLWEGKVVAKVERMD